MDLQYMIGILPEFLSVIPVTLLIVVVSAIAGFLLSILVAAVRIKRVPVLNFMTGLYISFTRSIPILLQLFLFFFGIPVLLQMSGFDVSNISAVTAATVCLTIYNGAYMSEVIRPAYLAIEKGQHEAAESLGYNGFQKFTRIILPQMTPIALPGLGNALIHLIHDSSLVFAIGVVDIMGLATIISSESFGMQQVEVFLTVAFIYWGISFVSEQLIRYLERRKKRVLGKTDYEMTKEVGYNV
ncbi:MAG TPA: amino acid ABC transporter permease [Candidatus Salinicoccus stercoripullorum]|uniref:Amino acid ABC transporter permease n=1 Tax=Candidatus Salinicoccus stercoripullorum TaxID=2838756 RepID=A0A9D1QG39_9STAP|nr:amino acid ABC transporter permease [Candidatus Salinicoccus stercoripullorum]